MNDKKQVEFRYYDIPPGEIVFLLTGPGWNKAYGEGKDKLHFHNYYEVGICHDGEGEMTLGEQEYHFHSGCISLIPTKELHTTNTFGKTAGWEWMYFDIHEVLKELYPDDEILREHVGHEIDKEGWLLFPEMDIQKMTFLIRGIFSEMQDKEYMYRNMVARYLMMLVVEIIRKLQNTDLPASVPATVDIFSAIDYVNFVRIQKGCSLLRETDMTVAMVSERIGYESVSTFIRNFRRIIGCTPNKWKNDEEYVKNKFTNYKVTALKGWLE